MKPRRASWHRVLAAFRVLCVGVSVCEPTFPGGSDTGLDDLTVFALVAIPSLGVGKLWSLGGGTTLNSFVEPQYSVLRSGVGVPKWQMFGGVNVQFPL